MSLAQHERTHGDVSFCRHCNQEFSTEGEYWDHVYEMDSPLVGELQQLKELLGRVVEYAKLVDRDDARAVCKEADSYLSSHNSVPTASGSVSGEFGTEEEDEEDISDGGSEMEEKVMQRQQQQQQHQLMMQQHQQAQQQMQQQMQHHHLQQQQQPQPQPHPMSQPQGQPLFQARPQHLDVFNAMRNNTFTQMVPRGMSDDISLGLAVGSLLSPRMDLNGDDFFQEGKPSLHTILFLRHSALA